MKKKSTQTRKQFVDRMVSKGKSEVWAGREFERRRVGNTEWETGEGLETKLPTVQRFGSDAEETYSDEFAEDACELETKQCAATKKNVFQILQDLASDGSDASMVATSFASGNLTDLVPGFSAAAGSHKDSEDEFSVSCFFLG